MIVHHDLVQWQSGDFRRRRLDPRNGLIADPYFAAVLADMSGAVHRLHGGVGQERNLIDRLDLGRRVRHCAVDVADGLGDSARLERCLLEFCRYVARAELGVRPVVPFDLQRREALRRRSHMVGDDGDGIVETHDLAHALDGLGRRIIHALHAPADHRRLRQGRDLDARRPNVDAVDGGAVDLDRRVQPSGRRADEFEILRFLKDNVGRDGMCAASAETAPYASLRPVSGWSTSPLCARHDAGSTFHRAAAAATSMVRAVAPAWRSGFHAPRIAFELPVACTPSKGFA
jgi:hypothetical protein